MKRPAIALVPLAGALIVLFLALARASAQEPTLETASQLYADAERAWRKGEWKRSLALCDKALAHDAKLSDAWILKAQNYWQLKDHAKAVEAYDRFLTREPKNDLAWANSGASVFAMAKKELAVGSPQANQRAMVLLKDMERRFARAERIDRNSVTLLMNRGINYLVLGQYARSSKSLKRLAELKKLDRLGQQRVFVTWADRLLRIVDGKGAPKATWRPNYSAYHTVIDFPGPQGYFVNMNPKPGTLISFRGSAKRPFEYAPNFYVWDGAVLWDRNADCLLRDGTRYRHVIEGSDGITIREGVIAGWKAVAESTKTFP